MMQNNIQKSLTQLHQEIKAAAEKYSRRLSDIQLVAVSKSRSVDEILAAYEANQRDFAENYVQEAITKIEKLKKYPLTWHFIGKIQGNKTSLIASHFDWVHTIDSFNHALQLNQHRPQSLPPLQVCIQVNLQQEVQKGGVRVDELVDLAERIVSLPCLKLRGLMCIPKETNVFEEQRILAKSLRILKEVLNRRGLGLDTLSIGMSHDYIAAIAEGATILRIGQAIFSGNF